MTERLKNHLHISTLINLTNHGATLAFARGTLSPLKDRAYSIYASLVVYMCPFVFMDNIYIYIYIYISYRISYKETYKASFTVETTITDESKLHCGFKEFFLLIACCFIDEKE